MQIQVIFVQHPDFLAGERYLCWTEILPFMIYSLQFTVYSLHFTVYSLQFLHYD
jgi:hypothetical protein